MTRLRSWTRLTWALAALGLAGCTTNPALSDQPAAGERSKSGPAPSPSFSVRWFPALPGAGGAAVEVSGFSAETLQTMSLTNWTQPQWEQLLAVFVGPDRQTTGVGLPPMLGLYRVEPGRVRFEPQFPLQPGVSYRAVFRPDHLPAAHAIHEAITALFHVPPRPARPATVVSQIYPTADFLPENLLKFYLHFSAPMSRGHSYDHIHLRNETGQEIELPFLELDEELWNPALTRLTLFIDPGRIKRGVLPLEEIGPALESGKSYTLFIDEAWQDGMGQPLQKTFKKTFRVGPPDRIPPDPTTWKLSPPRAETRGPLTVVFPKPMDHALAERVIGVLDQSAGSIAGETALQVEERRWLFTPAQTWRRGAYWLVVQTTIEDLAGNNIGKPFEVDLFEGVQRRLNTSTVKLSFEVH